MNSSRSLRLARNLINQRYSAYYDTKEKKYLRFHQRSKILEKYQGRNNIFGSFTSIAKLGINPRSQYNTPTGIYSYPIDYIINHVSESEVDINVPFPSQEEATYTHIFEVQNTGKCLYFNIDYADKTSKYKEYDPEFEFDDSDPYRGLGMDLIMPGIWLLSG